MGVTQLGGSDDAGLETFKQGAAIPEEEQPHAAPPEQWAALAQCLRSGVPISQTAQVMREICDAVAHEVSQAVRPPLVATCGACPVASAAEACNRLSGLMRRGTDSPVEHAVTMHCATCCRLGAARGVHRMWCAWRRQRCEYISRCIATRHSGAGGGRPHRGAGAGRRPRFKNGQAPAGAVLQVCCAARAAEPP